MKIGRLGSICFSTLAPGLLLAGIALLILAKSIFQYSSLEVLRNIWEKHAQNYIKRLETARSALRLRFIRRQLGQAYQRETSIWLLPC